MDASFNAFDFIGVHLRTWMQSHTRSRAVTAGDVLIEEASIEPKLCLIEAGVAHLTTSATDGKRVQLADVGPGTLIGEMCMLEDRPAVARVQAGAGCRVIDFDPQSLQSAMQKDLHLARDVNSLFARKLAKQLASQNSFIHRWHNVPAVEPLRKALVVFAHLSDIDVEWLASTGRRRHHADGAVLIHQGDVVPDLLLVLTGTGLVRVDSPSGPLEVGSSRAGELLGEMSLVGGDASASATVIAAGAMDVLALPKELMLQRLESDPAFGARFFRAMALLLSQRNRHQLLSRGLAATSLQVESRRMEGALSGDPGSNDVDTDLEAEESLDLDQVASISRAGQRFHWLCQKLGLSRGS